MRISFLLSLFPLLAAIPVAAADQPLLDLIAPDAAVVIGADFEKVRESPFGKYVLGTMNVPAAELEKFTQISGFDPMKDVQEILVFSSTPELRPDGLILVRGTFDQSKLTGIAGLQGAGIDSYRGFRILTAPKGRSKGPDMAMALLPGGLAIGPDSSLRAALDRSGSSRMGKDLADKLQRASAGNDVWVVTQVSPSKFAPRFRGQKAPGAAGGAGVDNMLNGNLIQGIEAVSAGVRFGANVVVSGQATARSEQDAAALGDVMKFLSNMVTSNASNVPAALVSMLGSLQTTNEGRTLRFTMSAPEAEIESILKSRATVRARPVSLR